MKNVGEDSREVWDERARRASGVGKFGFEGLSVSRRHEAADLLQELYLYPTVLDLGCGPGYLSAEIIARGHRVIGVDISPEMVKIARQRADGLPAGKGLYEFQVGSATDIPLSAGSVDCTVALNLIQDVQDPGAFLRETARVTRCNGLMIFTAPPRESLEFIFRYAPDKFDPEGGRLANRDENVDSWQQAYSLSDLRHLIEGTRRLEIEYIRHVTNGFKQVDERWGNFIPAQHKQNIMDAYSRNGCEGVMEMPYADTPSPEREARIPILYKVRCKVK